MYWTENECLDKGTGKSVLNFLKVLHVLAKKNLTEIIELSITYGKMFHFHILGNAHDTTSPICCAAVWPKDIWPTDTRATDV